MNKQAAMSALADTIKAYRAHKKWLDWCDGLHAVKVASGLYDKVGFDTDLSIALERVYAATSPKPKMPSKDAKHQMYGHAYRAAELADVNIPPGSIRTMEGIADVISWVTVALATAE